MQLNKMHSVKTIDRVAAELGDPRAVANPQTDLGALLN